MASGRVEISGLGDQNTRDAAIARIRRAFPSLSPGRRQDLVDVTAALLTNSPAHRRPDRLLVELERGRVRGEIAYRGAAILPGRAKARLRGWVASLESITALTRIWGVNDSGSGIWFDLGRN
jgi:hypothetical protein